MASSSLKIPGSSPNGLSRFWQDSSDDDSADDDSVDTTIERDMTKAEELQYFRAVKESEGFDVPEFPGVYATNRITPIPVHVFGNWLRLCTDEAMKHYNSNNDTNFEVVEIEKASNEAVRGCRFYITFKARPIGMPPSHSPTICFQAKVLYGIGEIITELCRIKPIGRN